MSRIKKIFLSAFLLCALVLIGFSVWIQDKHVIPIIMYHHVSSSDVPGMNVVNPQVFRSHMEYIKRHGYKVISLDELVASIKSQKPVNKKSVVISFDDGYINNYSQAYPILKEYGFPAIVFMVADLVGRPGYMNWDQLKEIKVNGFSVGSHTRQHAYLPDLSQDELIDEIAGSKRILEQGLGKEVKYFSYPSGGFSEEIKKIVEKVGYEAACTTNRGHGRMNHDLFELKRIRFNDDDKGIVLCAKLSGYYNSFRKTKNPR